MIQTVLLFILGLILICLGGDRLVDAAVAIAKKLGIPEIVVGATIVSLGTTLPEILVSTTAAFDGSAAIAAGNYDIMAAVMIGGMVPPIAIAIASLLFKNKFTEQERKAGPTNFVMGLSFITEGAIPFAAADPLHVIPACVVGAGVAGGLSAAFNCTLMAPHGGIFVFPVVGHAAMYLVALVVGSIISALLLGVLKKKVVA